MKKIKFTLTDILLLFLIIVVILSAGFNHYINSCYEKKITQQVINSKTNQKMSKLLDSLTNINQENIKAIPSYELKKEILELRQSNNEIRTFVQKQHEGFLSYFANFWTIIGLLLGSIAVVFSYREYTRKIVVEEVSKTIGKDVESLKKQIEQFEKHNLLKQEARIKILNKKNSLFPKSFKRVMKLFSVNLNDSNNLIEIDSLNELKNKYDEIKKNVDLLIIENKSTNSIWDLTNKDNAICMKNLNTEIHKETAILYYGDKDNTFPTIEDDEKSINVSFANASSQLYGNLLNMLKFINETKDKKI